MDVNKTTETATSLAKMLSEYGPWGVCAVLFLLIIGLYLHMSRKHENQTKELGDLLEKRHNQLLALIQRVTVALTNSNDMITENKALEEKHKRSREHEIDRLEEVVHQLKEKR